METGSNRSLFTLIAVVVFGIFLSLSYWLFQDDLKSVLANVLYSTSEKSKVTQIGYSDVILTPSDFYGYRTTLITTDDVFSFSSDGIFIGAGLRFSRDVFIPNKNYTLFFKITKESGTITNIGGHSPFSTYSEIYIDDVFVGTNWHAAEALYPNDNLTHTVKVNFNSNNLIIGSASDLNFYIQPNRYQYENKAYTVRLENIKLVMAY